MTTTITNLAHRILRRQTNIELSLEKILGMAKQLGDTGSKASLRVMKNRRCEPVWRGLIDRDFSQQCEVVEYFSYAQPNAAERVVCDGNR